MQSGPATIDTTFLARQTFGDERLQRDLLVLFVEQASLIGGALRDGTTDPASLHLLKGSSRAIGAAALSEAIERLEIQQGRKAGKVFGTLQASAAVLAAIDEACCFAASLIGWFAERTLAKSAESR